MGKKLLVLPSVPIFHLEKILKSMNGNERAETSQASIQNSAVILVRSNQDDYVSEALMLWTNNKVAQGARLSGPILKQKAHKIAASKGVDFTASYSWLWP